MVYDIIKKLNPFKRGLEQSDKILIITLNNVIIDLREDKAQLKEEIKELKEQINKLLNINTSSHPIKEPVKVNLTPLETKVYNFIKSHPDLSLKESAKELNLTYGSLKVYMSKIKKKTS